MLITEFVDVKIAGRNIKHYQALGYDAKVNQIINIPIEHLSKGSHVIVEVLCDYCKKEHVFKTYKGYLNQRENGRDCCKKCSKEKVREGCLEKYGVESVMQVEEYKNNLKKIILEKYGVEYISQTDENKIKVKEFWNNLSETELQEITNKTKETTLKKYGVNHYTQTEEYKDKCTQTCLEKYGVEHHSQSENVRQKYKDTCINKYGEDNYFKTDEFKEKQKETILEKYGVEYYSQSEEARIKNKEYWDSLSDEELQDIINKREETCLDRYGHKSPLQVPEIKEKTKETCLEKYGFENPLLNEEIKNKVKMTNMERYGYENPFQSDDIQEKCKQTLIDKYNVEHAMQCEEFKEKARKTCFNNYGVEHYSQSEDFRIKNKEYWDNLPIETMDDIINKRRETCLEKYGVESPMQVPEIKKKAIETLFKNGTAPTSSQQLEVYETIKKLFNENDVYLNYPVNYFMLDTVLFINNLKIDIEYDGWYWHNKEKDDIRDNYLIMNNWKVLRIKSGNKLPSIKQLQESLDGLINTDKVYKEIILDDWKEKEVAV